MCCGILAGRVHLSGPPFSRTPGLACITMVTWRPSESQCGAYILNTMQCPFLTARRTVPQTVLYSRLSCSFFLDTRPQGELIPLEDKLVGPLRWGPLLPRRSCGCALPGPLLQHVSPTGRSVVSGTCGLPLALCWEPREGDDLSLGVFVPGTQLALSRCQETFGASNRSPFLLPLWVAVSCWIAVWWPRLVRIPAG